MTTSIEYCIVAIHNSKLATVDLDVRGPLKKSHGIVRPMSTRCFCISEGCGGQGRSAKQAMSLDFTAIANIYPNRGPWDVGGMVRRRITGPLT